MGNLCDQMLSDLSLKKYSQKTVQAYLWCYLDLGRRYLRSPEELAENEIREFLLSSSGNPDLCLRSENASGWDQVSVPDHPANSGKS